MKRLGLITLMAAVLTLGLTISMPASAEAHYRGGRHHQGQGWEQGGRPGYHQQGYYRHGGKPGYHQQGYYGPGHRNQGQGWHKGWANSQKGPQGYWHNGNGGPNWGHNR